MIEGVDMCVIRISDQGSIPCTSTTHAKHIQVCFTGVIGFDGCLKAQGVFPVDTRIRSNYKC